MSQKHAERIHDGAAKKRRQKQAAAKKSRKALRLKLRERREGKK